VKTIPLNNGHVAVVDDREKESWYRKPENMRVNKVIEEAVKNSIRDEVIAATKKIQVNINHHIGEFIKAQLNEAAARLK
jgi:hypothetical protein